MKQNKSIYRIFTGELLIGVLVVNSKEPAILFLLCPCSRFPVFQLVYECMYVRVYFCEFVYDGFHFKTDIDLDRPFRISTKLFLNFIRLFLRTLLYLLDFFFSKFIHY
jgi:amino acid transporter